LQISLKELTKYGVAAGRGGVHYLKPSRLQCLRAPVNDEPSKLIR
jgi:hypothetical protein